MNHCQITDALLTTDPNKRLDVLMLALDFKSAEVRAAMKGMDHLTDGDRRELATKAKALGPKMTKALLEFAGESTLRAWQAKFCRKASTEDKTIDEAIPLPGRPKVPQETEDLTCRLAKENSEWGYERIQGELAKLGSAIDKITVRNILLRNEMEPAPERVKRESWEHFRRSQAHATWAADFFTAKVWHQKRMEWDSYYILFFIHHETREVVISGLTMHPNRDWMEECGDWMAQQARNQGNICERFTDDKFLILDRDTKFTEQFKDILEGAGLEIITSRHPNMNPFAERFVRSIKEEWLDKFIFESEDDLRTALRTYKNYYMNHRPHQGRGNIPPSETPAPIPSEGDIVRLADPSGILAHYTRVPKVA